MKPLQAAADLRRVVDLLGTGEEWPPYLRAWLRYAFEKRLSDQHATLDTLLGLRSRGGGRGGHIGSLEPARNERLRLLAQSLPGTTKAKAEGLLAMAQRGELSKLPGRLPGKRQLQRILADDR